MNVVEQFEAAQADLEALVYWLGQLLDDGVESPTEVVSEEIQDELSLSYDSAWDVVAVLELLYEGELPAQIGNRNAPVETYRNELFKWRDHLRYLMGEVF